MGERTTDESEGLDHHLSLRVPLRIDADQAWTRDMWRESGCAVGGKVGEDSTDSRKDRHLAALTHAFDKLVLLSQTSIQKPSSMTPSRAQSTGARGSRVQIASTI